MSQTCKCCQLPDKKQLEKDYISGINRHQLSKRYGVSETSVHHHVTNCLPKKIVTGAQKQLETNSSDLLQRVEELHHWLRPIIEKTFEKEHFKTTLKAIAETKSVFQLTAQMVIELHKIKVLETENDNRPIDANIRLERLTKKELDIYFQLNQKLLGNRETIDLTGLTDNDFLPILRKITEPEQFEEVEKSQDSGRQERDSHKITHHPKAKPKRTKYSTSKQQPNDDEQPMTFKPIPESIPVKDYKLERTRRAFGRFLHESDNTNPDHF